LIFCAFASISSRLSPVEDDVVVVLVVEEDVVEVVDDEVVGVEVVDVVVLVVEDDVVEVVVLVVEDEVVDVVVCEEVVDVCEVVDVVDFVVVGLVVSPPPLHAEIARTAANNRAAINPNFLFFIKLLPFFISYKEIINLL
jgi:hypothetical protein